MTLHSYDRIWWFIVIGGVITSMLALPMRTAIVAPVTPPTATAGP